MRAAPFALTTAVSRSLIGAADNTYSGPSMGPEPPANGSHGQSPRSPTRRVRITVMAVAPVSTDSVPAAAPTAYAERRAELMRRIGPNGALLLASPPEHLRNGDTHFKFRQDSDILYLTGFEEPGALVVLRPGHETMRFVMFVRPRDPAEETWTGRRAGIEGAVRDFGADAA